MRKRLLGRSKSSRRRGTTVAHASLGLLNLRIELSLELALARLRGRLTGLILGLVLVLSADLIHDTGENT